jgi:hypothetical protein
MGILKAIFDPTILGKMDGFYCTDRIRGVSLSVLPPP